MLYAYEAEGDRLKLVVPEGFEEVITSSSDGTRLYYLREHDLYVYSTREDQSRFIASAEGLEKFSGSELAAAITASGSRFLFQSEEIWRDSTLEASSRSTSMTRSQNS